MNKREDIVQKFSTFLSFGERHAVWQADPQLERQMKRLVLSDPDAKAEFWARYFLKRLKDLSQEGCQEYIHFNQAKIANRGNFVPLTPSKPLDNPTLITARHLSAYLQEACLWAAQKSYLKYKFLQHRYPLEEYFQIASSFAQQPAKMLKSFNLDHPRCNIEGYAKTVLFRLIRDQLYQQDVEVKREKFSDYGLLRSLNAKELKEALLSQGIQQQNLDLYRLAWQCFQEIYSPQKELETQKLESPSQDCFKQIAERYNQRLNQLNFLEVAEENENTIQQMLELCIKAARNYRTKQFIPLEEYDNICDLTLTPLDTAIQQEERNQIQLIISKLFATLPEAGKIILILGQGLDLTQTEIATVVKNQYPELQKQYQVARHLAKYTKSILKEFVIEWNQVNPSYAINNEESLEIIKEALDECLQAHCKQWVNSILEIVIQEMSDSEKLLLFAAKSNPVNEQILREKQALINPFIDRLEQKLSLSKNAILPVCDKISNWLEKWLICIK